MQDRWAKFGDELLRSGRADEALTCYDRAAVALRAPAQVPPAGDEADHGRKLALGGRLDEAAAWYGLERRDARPVDVAPGEVVVCTVVRNELARLPYFLRHYRGLGATRFLFVDNDSSDGTERLLIEEPDVHLWRTAGSFRTGRYGSAWFQVLLERHALDRWCLIVDADEILLYAECEARSLAALCAELDASGKRALTAVLLDMYSDRPVADTFCLPGESPLAACPYFDRQWYHYRQTLSGPHRNQTLISGGVRRRVFGDDERQFWLQKAPLVKYGQGTVLFPGQHWTGVPRQAIAEETGCLLHFKYLSSFPARAREEAERQQHADGAREYRRYAQSFRAEPSLTLHDPSRSVRLEGGSRQLADLGIIVRGAPRATAGLWAASGGRSRHVLIYTDCPRIYGAEQANHVIARRLVADGLRVTFVQSFADNSLVEERRALGIQHAWLGFDTVADAGEGHPRASSNDAEARSLLETARPDLVVFADGLPVASLAAKRTAAGMGVPFVIIEHLVEPGYQRPGAPPPLEALAAAYRHARAVVTVCHASLQSLRARFGLPHDRGEVIYSGSGPAFFTPRDPAGRRRVRAGLGIPDDAIVALTTARLDPSKGHQYQLAAMHALRQSALWPRLFFLWAGSGGAAPALRLAIDRLDAAGQVRLLGVRDDVPALLDAADLFLLPSRREGLPMSVLEAMAKGLPVAASAVDGVPEALGETGRVLPDPRSAPQETARALAETVLAWAEDEPLRATIGRACQRRAQQRFTQQRMLDDYGEMIRRALG